MLFEAGEAENPYRMGRTVTVSITIEESKTLHGRPPLEDLIGTQGTMAWVIDGATSRSTVRVAPDHPSDGAWLVARLDEQLRRLHGSEQPLSDILQESIAAVADCARREWIGEPEVPPSAALALTAMREPGRLEYAVLADCTFATDVNGRAFVVSDDRPDADNSGRLSRLTNLLEEHSFDAAIEILRPSLIERRLQAMNRKGPSGYWVASTNPLAANEAIYGAVEVVPGGYWWLLSDGMARCVDLFRLYDWDSFVDLHGFDLEKVLRDVLEVEHRDPEARVFPRLNISDDKAAARLTWCV
jgi:hypothetical protein